MRRTRRGRDNARARNRRSMHAQSRAGTDTHCRAHMDSGANMDAFTGAELDSRSSRTRRYGRSFTHEHAFRDSCNCADSCQGSSEYRNPVANGGSYCDIDEHQYPDYKPCAIAYNYCDSYDLSYGNRNTDCGYHGHPYANSNYHPNADRDFYPHTAPGRRAQRPGTADCALQRHGRTKLAQQ